uniref:Putative gypsy-69 cq-i n=1 Tax=Aedes albopictus TaxID=7160 RepID=A0A1W7R5T5_AEDAL|nr:uncharacterized protein LOC115265015 [Aedes albopictus]
MIKFSFLSTILVASVIQAQNLQILNLNDQPILILNKYPCKIQIGNFRIIHEINITDLETTINMLTNLAYKNIDNPLANIVKHKIKNLYSNFNQIRPNTRYTRSLDIIGSTWKWIGGSPDAHDLKIINSTMNDLIKSNNLQFQFNEQLGQRVRALTNEMRKMIEINQANKLILNEIDTLSTIINIDTINKILEEIQEAISLSKVSVTSNKILSTREITIIKNILEDQGVNIDLPDEAISFVTPKIAVNKETLLYILKVPELQKEESKIIQIFPLNHNNSIIKAYPKYLIQHKMILYTTTHPEKYVQQHSYINKFADDCIYPMVMGTSSHCEAQQEYSTTADYIADNLLLITNAKNQMMMSNCGPDNRTMNGNFLITFSNCSILFEKQKFTSKEIITKTPVLDGATYNIAINRKFSENTLESLDNRTLKNRKQIQHIYLQQSRNEIWNWSLLSGITISTLVTITIIVFAYFYFSHLTMGILNKIKKKKNNEKAVAKHTEPEQSVVDNTNA